MKNEIVDYLTVEIMKDKNFIAPVAQRVRRAWMLAEEKYNNMNQEEKREMYLYISMKRSKTRNS